MRRNASFRFARASSRHGLRIADCASSFLKILILKPSSLGDVVQALPVLRLLKLHLPNSEIFWWIDSRLRTLLDPDPDLSGILSFERRRWSSPLHWDELNRSTKKFRCRSEEHTSELQSLAYLVCRL